MNDYQMMVLDPVCPDCGADVSALVRTVELDWRDEREERLGVNADAVQQHRATVHLVRPKVGDIVVYYSAWRGLIIGNGPLRVEGIWPADPPLGALYRLVNPTRVSDYYMPSTGDVERPITFELITEYVAPPVEASLFDLLGDEWAGVAA
jgi:hypothetical protein